MMLLIKLGGSVITNKEKECVFLEKRARRLVEEMRYTDEPMMLTHGAGSFGHKKAGDYRLREGHLEDTLLDQIKGFSEVQKDVRDLNTRLLAIMNRFDIRGVSVPTSAIVTFADLQFHKMDFGMYNKVLKMGSVPVGFGDVVFDTRRLFAICSADTLMIQLAKKFKPSMAIFVTDVDGLFGANPDVKPNAHLISEVRSIKDIPKRLKVNGAKKRDVTGGMYRKAISALEIASHGVETLFINGSVEDRLAKVLKGREVVCTRFVAKKPAGSKRSKRSKGGRKG
jgi:isopentenyl phosphate kinase